jgi:DNA processing protein
MTRNHEEQLLDWVQLIRSENVGPLTFWALLDHYGSASSALSAIPELSKRGGRQIIPFPRSQAAAEIERHQQLGYHLITGYDETFPSLLRQIPDAPPILSLYGSKDILRLPSLAIVGARNASLLGRQLATKLAQQLSHKGIKVVSGLARGIDKHAHEGSLEQGTIAVLAGGIEVIYPPEHEKLYHQIALNGAVLSEMPSKMHPSANHFPRRNRLISGLSLGVIVVEAALKSGSLITAQFALDQNRELFAVPGSPLDPRCQGSNHLLRQGAHLVEKVEDILRVVQNQTFPYKSPTLKKYILEESSPKMDEKGAQDLHQRLLDDLSATPISVDYLLDHYRCSYAEFSVAILSLELSGKIQRLPGNMVYRIY